MKRAQIKDEPFKLSKVERAIQELVHRALPHDIVVATLLREQMEEIERLRVLVADAWGEGLRCGHSRASAGLDAHAVTEDWMASRTVAAVLNSEGKKDG